MQCSFRNLLSLCVAGLLCAGCGESDPWAMVPVSGVVLFDGVPVPNAQVVFMPPQGLPATGQTDAEGRFTLQTGGKPGAAPGQAQISVTAFEWIRPVTRGEMEGLPREELAKLQKWPFPQKFGNAQTSGLVIEVLPGKSNDVVVDLK